MNQSKLEADTKRGLSTPQRLKGVFSGGVGPLSNVSAGTALQATVESA